ncbi:unnamed protein product [Colias eurytheme]|nr:unnamed protein product [Colias eurytheme]
MAKSDKDLSCINNAIQQPAAMLSHGNMAENWRDWKKCFDWYLIASGRENAPGREKCALFLHSIGKCGREIYEELDFQSSEINKYDVLCLKFQERLDPKKNINYERHLFFECYQNADESFECYFARLKIQSKVCSFGQLRDSLILTQLIRGIRDAQLRERLLRKKDLELNDAESWCRAAEAACHQAGRVDAPAPPANKIVIDTQIPGSSSSCMNEVRSARSMVGRDVEVEAVSSRGARARASGGWHGPAWPARPQRALAAPQHQGHQVRRTRPKCAYCDRMHQYNKCPAFNVSCYRCDKRGHFAKCCRYSAVSLREVNRSTPPSEGSGEEYIINGIEINTIDGHAWFDYVYVNGKAVMFKLDSGADVCVMSLSSYLSSGFSKRDLLKTNVILKEVSKNKLSVIGYFMASITYKSLKIHEKIFVLNLNCSNLLSRDACVKLNMIMRINEIKNCNIDFFVQYKSVFEGIGELPGFHRIIVDERVPPVVRSARKIPIKLRPKLKEELNRLQQLNIIMPVSEPTDWVSNIVLVKKPDGKLRICLDPKFLNEAIKRCHFQLPTLDEIIANLSGANYFSVLDASKGFYMLKLDYDSSKLCTFATPFGRYRFLRLPFGISSACEVFHSVMHRLFACEGVETYVDDVLVYGKTKEEHDERLHKVLQCAVANGVRFNRDKCKFGVREVKFLGHIFNSNGIKPDPDRIRVIRDMSIPVNRKELERFLGMSNYVSRFIPNYAKLVEPLRSLLKNNVQFDWHEIHTKAYNKIKTSLMNAPSLRFYDPNKQVTVSVDASAFGLGACLLQEGRPVAFAARALTPAESRWAQIEKEMLAIVYGCSKFHQFVYGHTNVIVESDHKPLESIFKKPLNDIPIRLQRLLLKLQRYSLNVCYVPGKLMFIADTLSRTKLDNLHSTEDKIQKDVEGHVNLIIQNTGFSDEKLKLVENETRNDVGLCKAMDYYKTGWPHTKALLDGSAKVYWDIRDEFHVIKNIAFKNHRVIIPTSLRKEMINRIHEGHLGIDKCKNRARDVMWWPGMSADIERAVRRCGVCAQHRAEQPREPLLPHPQPDTPWEVLAADIFQIKNKYFILVVDYYSKYVEVASLRDITSGSVIKQLKDMFSRHGIPKRLISDNGLQFTSGEFKNFSEAWGFRHVTSSPYYPRSNGLAERNVQTVKNY